MVNIPWCSWDKSKTYVPLYCSLVSNYSSKLDPLQTHHKPDNLSCSCQTILQTGNERSFVSVREDEGTHHGRESLWTLSGIRILWIERVSSYRFLGSRNCAVMWPVLVISCLFRLQRLLIKQHPNCGRLMSLLPLDTLSRESEQPHKLLWRLPCVPHRTPSALHILGRYKGFFRR